GELKHITVFNLQPRLQRLRLPGLYVFEADVWPSLLPDVARFDQPLNAGSRNTRAARDKDIETLARPIGRDSCQAWSGERVSRRWFEPQVCGLRSERRRQRSRSTQSRSRSRQR